MSFTDNDNWQIDPFTGTLGFVPRTEGHTVRQYSNFGNRFGIWVDYNILFTNPSTVSIPGYTEVGFGTAPSINQFRIDYDNLRSDGTVIETIKYKNTAFIEFNPGANGANVTVTYRGTGRVVSGKNLASFLAGENISANSLTTDAGVTVGTDLQVDGNSQTDGNQTVLGTTETDILQVNDDGIIDGNLIVGDGSTGTGTVTADDYIVRGKITGDTSGDLEIDPNNNTITGLANGVNPGDAVNKSQLDSIGSGNLGFATGTVAGRSGVGTTTRNISLPSTGNWLMIINANFGMTTNGSCQIERSGTGIVAGIANNVGANFSVNCSGHLYVTGVNSISLDLVIATDAGATISTVRYQAIRIS